jgi:hypothetical protein
MKHFMNFHEISWTFIRFHELSWHISLNSINIWRNLFPSLHGMIFARAGKESRVKQSKGLQIIRIVYWSFSVGSWFCTVGELIVHTFAKGKMGMMRHWMTALRQSHLRMWHLLRTGQIIGQAPWAFDSVDMCAIEVFNQSINQSINYSFKVCCYITVHNCTVV